MTKIICNTFLKIIEKITHGFSHCSGVFYNFITFGYKVFSPQIPLEKSFLCKVFSQKYTDISSRIGSRFFRIVNFLFDFPIIYN